MRSTMIALLVLVLAGGVWGQKKHRTAPAGEEGQQRSREAADQAAIQKLQERDIAASMAFDVEALLALWTDDGVLLAPGHAPITGKDNLRAFYEKQWGAVGNAEILAYDTQWQEVRILGDYAYQWGQIQSRTRTGQGKEEQSSVVNAMRILKRSEDGSWKVARAIFNEARSGTSVGGESVPKGERP